jgi:hypothetical protein
MASTCCLPRADSYPYGPIFELDIQSSKPPGFPDAQPLGFAIRSNVSMVDESAPVDDHRFLPAPTPSQFLSPGRMANLYDDGESSDSDDGGLPSVRKIVAHARQKVVIDLTLDDDEGDGDGDDATEVSWQRNTRTPQRMRLILLSRIDRLRTIDRLPSLPPVLAERTHHRRSHNAVHSGHTWQKEISLEECSFMVTITQKASTTRRLTSS